MIDSSEYKIVKFLEGEIFEIQSNLNSKKKELEVAEINLRAICKHDYYAEDNGDYHKPGWYYVCSICKHWTNYRPEKFRFN
jgi:hypothetical protein